MPIPLIVISGYLGAGKTTLVRRIIPALDQRGLKGVLIENEIGEMNVDGALAADSSIQQIELLGGCVCCSMRGDLFSALSDAIREYQPDYLLLEASGLAEPAEIVDAATAEPLSKQLVVTDILSVCDAPNFALQLKVGELAKLQVRFASSLVLNKVDAVRERELEKLTEKLRELNGHAPLYAVEHAQVEVEQALSRTLAWLAGDGEAPAHHHHTHGHDHHHHHHHHAGHFALNVELPEFESAQALLDLLAALPEKAYRIKGFARIKGSAQPWVFQRVGVMPPRATEFTLDGVPVPIGMVLIGANLAAEDVDQMLHEAGARVRSLTE